MVRRNANILGASTSSGAVLDTVSLFATVWPLEGVKIVKKSVLSKFDAP